jgi:hypothetical protein
MIWDKNKFEDWEYDGYNYTDYSDTCLIRGKYDGRELTEEEIHILNTEHHDLVCELIYN